MGSFLRSLVLMVPVLGIEVPAFAQQEVDGSLCGRASQDVGVHPWTRDPKGPRDWIELDSGEWLAGRFIKMDHSQVHFESDKLDILIFDWDDIAQLKTVKPLRVVFKNDKVVVGLVDLPKTGEVRLCSHSGVEVLQKDDVVALLENDPRELHRWALRASLGINYSRGNTDSADLATAFLLERRDDFTQTRLDYQGAFGRVNEETNTNKHYATGSFFWILSSHTYLIPFFGSVRHDRFQNLSLRYTLGAGVGLRPIDLSAFSLDVSVGLGYQHNRYISVGAGIDPSQKGLSLPPRIEFDWDMTSALTLRGSWFSGLVLTDISQTYHHGELHFSVDLKPRFFVDFAAIYDRQEAPVTTAGGDTPLKNDLSSTFNIGVDLQ